MKLGTSRSAYLCTRRARHYEAVQFCRAQISFSRMQRHALAMINRLPRQFLMLGSDWPTAREILTRFGHPELIARLDREQSRWR